jgi:hypothetical protein
LRDARKTACKALREFYPSFHVWFSTDVESWTLGTCIPKEILGPSGYLPLKQTCIDSMALITAGACRCEANSQHPIDLSTFDKLKRLSWNGLQSESHIQTLRNTLRRLSDQLVELDVGFRDFHKAKNVVFADEDHSDSSFARTILGLPSGIRARMFPSIQVLSLSAVSLTSSEVETAYAFNFGSLRSMKLRFCPGWEKFLLNVRNSNQPIRLKSLEVQHTVSYDEPASEEGLAGFLAAFEGLEELFLSSSHSMILDIWRATLHHKATLRRFVHHQRTVDDEGEECDVPSLMRVPRNIAIMKDPSQNPLIELSLECMGVSSDPRFLVCALFSPFSADLGD